MDISFHASLGRTKLKKREIEISLEKVEICNDTDFKKLNTTYFSIFHRHFSVFIKLIEDDCFDSAISLGRTMLEIYVKSFYVEFVLKEKNKNIIDYIEMRVKLPQFHIMADELSKVKHKNGIGIEDHFIQFTQKDLSTYSKFSDFTHCSGEYLKGYFDSVNGICKIDPNTVLEVLEILNGMFELMFKTFIFVQGRKDLFIGFMDKKN